MMLAVLTALVLAFIGGFPIATSEVCLRRKPKLARKARALDRWLGA